MSHDAQIDQVAEEVFGFGDLRAGQREAIASVLDGRDTLAVMATGSGKSAIYQIAGLLIPGLTVVVSPLIALQQDQVSSLAERREGIQEASAAQLNSTLTAREREQVFAELAEGTVEFLFLAPEQLANAEVLDRLVDARPSLLVVDEAHCVTEWGHDFRPEYLRLGAARERLGSPVVLALTATAAGPVRGEIVERLGMQDPAVLVRGFDRPEIHLSVDRFHDEGHQRRALVEAVDAARVDGPGIVYAPTQRTAEGLAQALADHGIAAAHYHGGMGGRDRDAVHEAFMNGLLDVVVATTAFGMGVDKADVRFVFHSAPSASLDSYYQEIGRAGRDGLPARARLFYRTEDLGLRRFFAAGGNVAADELEAVLDQVTDGPEATPAPELRTSTDLSETKLSTALTRLQDVGALSVAPDGEVAPTGAAEVDRAGRDRFIGEALVEQERRERFEGSRVEMMRTYAEAPGCRRAVVLAYFGEPFTPPCGNCDNCDAGRGDVPEGEVPFPLGSRVRHASWGEGEVQRYGDEEMAVLFDEVGYKTLATDLVVERGLLEAVGESDSR